MTKDDHRAFSYPYPVLPHHWHPYDASVDYCGSETCKISTWVSRSILGIDCNVAYWAHDQRYGMGGSKSDRKFADRAMRRDQWKIIREATRWYSPRRYLAGAIALRRYHVVRLLAGKAFACNPETP